MHAIIVSGTFFSSVWLCVCVCVESKFSLALVEINMRHPIVFNKINYLKKKCLHFISNAVIAAAAVMCHANLIFSFKKNFIIFFWHFKLVNCFRPRSEWDRALRFILFANFYFVVFELWLKQNLFIKIYMCGIVCKAEENKIVSNFTKGEKKAK